MPNLKIKVLSSLTGISLPKFSSPKIEDKGAGTIQIHDCKGMIVFSVEFPPTPSATFFRKSVAPNPIIHLVSSQLKLKNFVMNFTDSKVLSMFANDKEHCEDIKNILLEKMNTIFKTELEKEFSKKLVPYLLNTSS